MRVYRSDVVSLRSAEAKPPRSVHRLDEPAGLSLSMVTSPQCRFRFARQNHCSAAATSAVNFRMARHRGAIRREHLCEMTPRAPRETDMIGPVSGLRVRTELPNSDIVGLSTRRSRTAATGIIQNLATKVELM